MDMFVSLRRYLEGPSTSPRSPEPLDEALFVLAHGLLEAFESKVLLDAPPSLRSLQSSAAGLHQKLDGMQNTADAEAVSAEASQLLEQYRAGFAKLQEAQAAAIHHMLDNLNETVAVLSGGSQRSVARLRQIEKDLKGAAALEDIVALKSRLKDCMHYVQEEAAREREEVAHNLLLMKETIARVGERVQFLSDGIPGRAEAEQMLLDPALAGHDMFSSIFVLDRYQSIATRFGEAAAEQAIDSFAEELRQRIADPKRLYRWNDSAILLQLERAAGKSTVMTEIQDLNLIVLEKNVDTGDRMAVLSLSHHWTVFAVAEFPERARLVERIGEFAEAQA